MPRTVHPHEGLLDKVLGSRSIPDVHPQHAQQRGRLREVQRGDRPVHVGHELLLERHDPDPRFHHPR